MEEVVSELARIRKTLAAMRAGLVVIALLIASMIFGTLKAASAAGPRIAAMRKENDLLRKENVRLRNELEKGQKPPTVP